MCQHLHASSCEEEHLPDGAVRCVCTCPPGQHAETVPESTHLAANLAPGRVFCEDDCNCSRFHRCAGPEDVLECPPPPSSDLQECKPKYHCWDDASGYTTCRKLHPSNCSDTNSSHCNCTCPCVDVDECRVSRWIRFVLGWLWHHHHHHLHFPWWLGHHPHLLPTTTPPPTWNPAPRTTTTPAPNDDDNPNGEIDPITSTTPKPGDDPNDDPNNPTIAVWENVLVHSFFDVFFDVFFEDDGGSGMNADSFFDVFFDIDVGAEPGRVSERIAELLHNTFFRPLLRVNRTLLDSFFDVWTEIELGNMTLPELCENGTCVNTHGSFLCEACNCSLPGHARECAAKPSEHCPDPWHCHELYPSECEEGERGRCECACPDGQHLHKGAGGVLTHALTHVENAGIAGGLWYCADDVC
ncbi:hypothetical protein T484DRAFT_3647787, partial [Baffinella frigidus]